MEMKKSEKNGVVDEIILTEKTQLAIYMNPTRQTLLREMERVGEPVTPKFLADRIGISASAVQFHMKKLLELGILELDHTEQIRGITAKYYKTTRAIVRLGVSEGEFFEEKEVLMEHVLMDVYKGFLQNVKMHGKEMKEGGQYGDIIAGTVYLTDREAKELFQKTIAFIKEHSEKRENTVPWELGMISYRMEQSI
ncbi:MAG: hypothetical protein PWP24_632 [Clostridiales bacterium]|nr:hypothetical protein [Clostridiales bacterium]